MERTTATGKVRRVALFDADVVRRAIRANKPDRIALNHLDYFDPHVRDGGFDAAVLEFVEREVEAAIGQSVDWIGTSPTRLVERSVAFGAPSRRKVA